MNALFFERSEAAAFLWVWITILFEWPLYYDSAAQNQMGLVFTRLARTFFRVFSGETGLLCARWSPTTPPGSTLFLRGHNPALTGQRSQLNSSRPMQLAVLAQRAEIKPILACRPQQSDYAAAWERHPVVTQMPSWQLAGSSACERC